MKLVIDWMFAIVFTIIIYLFLKWMKPDDYLQTAVILAYVVLLGGNKK